MLLCKPVSKMFRLGVLSLTFSLLIMFVGAQSADSQCKVVDGDREYDLSELAAQDYWEVIQHLHTGTKRYYLSLCHPLRNVPEGCAGNNTGVCAVHDPEGNGTNVFVSNRGQVPVAGFNSTEEGYFKYVYDSGEKCTVRGRDENYTTSIFFMCHSEDGVSEPILMNDKACDLIFVWRSMAACPKKLDARNSTTCTVQFSNSDYVLNLHMLHKPTYYTVKRENTTYEMNICGPVTNGSCGKEDATICSVNSGSSPVILGTTKDMLLEWKEEVLALKYQHQNMTVKIELHCDRTATKTDIYFVEENETSLTFAVRTSSVCSPKRPQCVLEDEVGNVYDLRPLYKSQGNWEALDTRHDHKDLLYHINICGQVNEGTHYHCPLGPIGTCQTSIGRQTAYNLGFLTSHPVLNQDGSITILYTGGDTCQDGQHTRSTRINLVCNAVEHHPMFLEETETCEYVFNWLTPVACPRHMAIGSSCKVVDPLYKYQYDLNPLRNSEKDYKISDGENDYLINLCGPLVSPCTGEKGKSGVCQVKGSDEYSGGLATSNVTFNKAMLIMNFNNGSGGCGDDNTRSSQILFLCDQEESGSDGPHFLHEGENCIYHFFWRTIYACPPFRVVDCRVTDNGMVYDLSELSSTKMNEEYFITDGSKKFVLNVCRSVVHSRTSRCPYTAASCIVDLKHENESLNIGEVHSGPYLENGILKLKYTDGEICEKKSKPYETIIEFMCDKHELYPYPQLIGEEDCTYFFEWKTPLACPVSFESSTSTTPSSIGKNCTVSSSITDYVFNLNPLKNETGYEVHNENGLHLTLNVCAKVSKEKCPMEGTAACSYMHNDNTSIINAGNANAHLQFRPGFLFLSYTGGDQCNNTVKRSTIISFICGAENAMKGPVLVHDDLDLCTYFVNWYTDLACERRINCFVDTAKHRIDLTPLIRATGNYETLNPENSKEKFYMNVCRPLNPIIGLNCQPGTAACLSTPSIETGPLGLGHPLVTPTYMYETDSVQIIYIHGSSCTSKPDYSISSRIEFICNLSAGKGNPVFKKMTHDCQYLFEWSTSLVCEDSHIAPDPGPVCQIKYDAAKTNVDLKPLRQSEGYTVNFGNKIYKINVCGPACNQSQGVCTSDGDNYGLSNKSELKWDYDQLKLTYYGGSPCNEALSGFKTTSIYFECDMNAGFGHPVADRFMEIIHCVAIFRWKTNVTCIEGIYGTGNDENVPDVTEKPSINDGTDNSSKNQSGAAVPQKSEVDKPYSALTAVVASLLVVSGTVFVAVLILFKSERGQRVVASARRLFGIRGHTTLLLDDVS
ncbi:cation-independent mannose-6-phosphate receptor-like isoform X2 [Homarus americanus]|uniref:cation-independent mannose-6-phosphate receptor-like isoform X2 n=1 Tax=Homarus americanus TaxID=6706 RepID=UPI001C456CE9|nr:cation-independent mannose-6-phosphate receptor-like isoform X2 [Homarus americanus]